MEVRLPEIMFDGASFRISPRAIEGNGIIAKLEYIPKSEIEGRSSDGSDIARLFKKKISEYRSANSRECCVSLTMIVSREILQEEGSASGFGGCSHH